MTKMRPMNSQYVYIGRKSVLNESANSLSFKCWHYRHLLATSTFVMPKCGHNAINLTLNDVFLLHKFIWICIQRLKSFSSFKKEMKLITLIVAATHSTTTYWWSVCTYVFVYANNQLHDSVNLRSNFLGVQSANLESLKLRIDEKSVMQSGFIWKWVELKLW